MKNKEGESIPEPSNRICSDCSKPKSAFAKVCLECENK